MTFGSVPVHFQMTLPQLDELRSKIPQLTNNSNFVETYLGRLSPSADTDPEDNAPKIAFLSDAYKFLQPLASVFNPQKLHVLGHLLLAHRAAGRYPHDIFLEYAKIPRHASYMPHPALPETASLGVTLRHGGLNSINDDTELVRDYLEHYFAENTSFSGLTNAFSEKFLIQTLAETRLLAGDQNEQWFKSVDNTEWIKSLRERVEIKLCDWNPRVWSADASVSLAVSIKNVSKLIVRVFELNTRNYYQTEAKEIESTVSLDGLVAHQELVFEYRQPSVVRHTENIQLGMAGRRGIFVVEFLGSSISARALLRKGSLRAIEAVETSGHVFSVVDENGKPFIAGRTSILMGGMEFFAEEESGIIRIPFSPNGRRKQNIVVVHNDFAQLASFEHLTETYTLSAAFCADREGMLASSAAQIIVSASLLLHGRPVSLSRLQNTTLTIFASLGETNSTKQLDVELSDDADYVAEFQIPSGVSSLTFTLQGVVTLSCATGSAQTCPVSSSRTIQFQEQRTDMPHTHLSLTQSGYALSVLGNNGEPMAHHSLVLQLTSALVSNPVTVVVTTNSSGVVNLGSLPFISELTARLTDGRQSEFKLLDLLTATQVLPTTLHVKAGTPLSIPYSSPFLAQTVAPAAIIPPPTSQAAVSFDHLKSRCFLFEQREGVCVRDVTQHLSVGPSSITIAATVPAGDYKLIIPNHPAHHEVRIRIAARATEILGSIVSPARILSPTNHTQAHIATTLVTSDEIVVTIAGNPSEAARVHVFATYFLPDTLAARSLIEQSTPQTSSNVITGLAPISQYLQSRALGDEVSYVLARQYEKTFPGNMLPRPSLLLRPWALSTAATAREQLNMANDMPYEERACAMMAGDMLQERRSLRSSPPFIDFLARPALVLANLRAEPGSDGTAVVRIPRNTLQGVQTAQIVFVDAGVCVARVVPLSATEMACKDLRLSASLGTTEHFAERRRISCLPVGQTLVLSDVSGGNYEIYDSLSKAFRLLLTVSQKTGVSSTLSQFQFLTSWNTLSTSEKIEKYDQYGCSELDLFISRKDPDFFNSVILPYLRNKHQPTFIDDFLMGANLEKYLSPWELSRLNTAEKSFLCSSPSISQKSAAALALLLSQQGKATTNDEQLNKWFDAALQGRAMESDPVVETRMMAAEVEARTFAPMAMMARAPRAMMAMAAPRMKKAMAPPPAQPLFEKLDTTKVFAERNYYNLRREEMTAQLVAPSAFWAEYAQHAQNTNTRTQPFLSGKFVGACRTVSEALLTLSILDLPFSHSNDIIYRRVDQQLQLSIQTRSPAIVFHKALELCSDVSTTQNILVSRSFFDPADRWESDADTQQQKQRLKKISEFLPGTIYGAEIVLTNISENPMRIDVLAQLPQGAIPMSEPFLYTRSIFLQMSAWETHKLETLFYFPNLGQYSVYPVHVTNNKTEQIIATSAPASEILNVVRVRKFVDKKSWKFISLSAPDAELFEYLSSENLLNVSLDDILWRLEQKPTYSKIIEILRIRCIFHEVIWAYGLKHQDTQTVAEYLAFKEVSCGKFLKTKLVQINPEISYQHLEFSPLVNARAHKIGTNRKILNAKLAEQYNSLLEILRYFPENFPSHFRLALCYYLLIMDRIDEARHHFSKISPPQNSIFAVTEAPVPRAESPAPTGDKKGKSKKRPLSETAPAEKEQPRSPSTATKMVVPNLPKDSLAEAVQYDYMRAYFDFYNEGNTLIDAHRVASHYQTFPVARFGKMFKTLKQQLDEISGISTAKFVDVDDKQQKNAQNRFSGWIWNFFFLFRHFCSKRLSLSFP
eukprot:TRINITY_DN1143_c0_g1_i1.p1 TRINITY_DN1143_c0_g1~~TRINITY_DN1143_c0_g1_i1.p1  ORF type:complete len:1982 (+),score=510.06 TRINITY_DN1143_c0_g1_i1:574-5946(+)